MRHVEVEGAEGRLVQCRKGDPNDERLTVLEITPKGRQTLRNISLEKDKNIEGYLSDCGDEEKNELLKSLRKLLMK